MFSFQNVLRLFLLLLGVAGMNIGHAALPGDLDPGFSGDGVLNEDIGCALSASTLMSVKLLRDAQGSLYTIGFCSTAAAGSSQGNTAIKIIKLDANGNRVTSFGHGGIATIDTTDFDTANAAALDGNGNLIIAGSSILFDPQPVESFGIWKMSCDSGALVASFGNNGAKILPMHNFSRAFAVLLDGAGQIYVGGQAGIPDAVFAVAKLDGNGNLVSAFGIGGMATFGTAANSFSNVESMALDGSGHLFLAGETHSNETGGNYDFAVVKIDAVSAGPNIAFGNNGLRTFDLGNNDDDFLNTAVLDGSGNIYLGGGTSTPISGDESVFVAALVKLDATTGTFVGTFGHNGIKSNFGGDGGMLDALAIDAAGHLYGAGTQLDNTAASSDLLITKFDGNGNPVTDFGSGGSKEFSITGADGATAMLLDDTGRMYVAGVAESDSGGSETPRVFLAARLFTVATAESGGTLHISHTTLSSSFNPAPAGSSISFTATVSASGAAPSGKVNFYDGNTLICANVTIASSHASCSTSGLIGRIAAHAISARYAGDASNLVSISDVLEQRVLGDEVFVGGFE